MFGPGGEVLGLDISEPMLARARQRAPQNQPVRFELADATVYDFKPHGADLVASRFGVMFFAEPARSFANLRKGLKPGGRLVFACWREPKQNPWLILPLREAAKHAPPLPETSPEGAGDPSLLASDARVRRILRDVGYADIELAPQDLELDVAVGKGLDTAVNVCDDDRVDEPDSRRPERGGSRGRDGGHLQGAGRNHARRRQCAARRGDPDGQGDQFNVTPPFRRRVYPKIDWVNANNRQ